MIFVLSSMSFVFADTTNVTLGKLANLSNSELGTIFTSSDVLTDGNLSSFQTGYTHIWFDFDTPVDITSADLKGESNLQAVDFQIYVKTNGSDTWTLTTNNYDSSSTNFSLNATNVDAIGFSGHSSFDWYEINVFASTQEPDIISPDEVTSLAYTHDDVSTINLTWVNPVDVDFNHVEVYKDDVLQTTTSGLTFESTGNSINTDYIFKLITVDDTGNKSTGSLKTASIVVDVIAPDEVVGISYTHDDVSVINFTWENPVNSDFNHVEVLRDNVLQGTSFDGTFESTGNAIDVDYIFKFITVDDTGNKSSGRTKDTIINSIADVIAPSDVTALNYTHDDVSTINLTWVNPVDSDFNHVEVYKDDVLQTTTSGLTFESTGNSTNTDYIFKLITVDDSGNKSTGSLKTASINELILDTDAPEEVTSMSAVFVEYKNTISWTNPIDSDLDYIEVYKDDVLLAVSYNETISDYNILSDTPYDYKVVAVDTSGNRNTGISATVTTETISENSVGRIFGTITDYFIDIFADLRQTAVNILGVVLGLTAFIVGVFYLLGLGKKAVKRAK